MLSDERSAATATGRLTQPYLRARYVPAARAARASSEKVYAFFSSEKPSCPDTSLQIPADIHKRFCGNSFFLSVSSQFTEKRDPSQADHKLYYNRKKTSMKAVRQKVLSFLKKKTSSKNRRPLLCGPGLSAGRAEKTPRLTASHTVCFGKIR